MEPPLGPQHYSGYMYYTNDASGSSIRPGDPYGSRPGPGRGRGSGPRWTGPGQSPVWFEPPANHLFMRASTVGPTASVRLPDPGPGRGRLWKGSAANGPFAGKQQQVPNWRDRGRSDGAVAAQIGPAFYAPAYVFPGPGPTYGHVPRGRGRGRSRSFRGAPRPDDRRTKSRGQWHGRPGNEQTPDGGDDSGPGSVGALQMAKDGDSVGGTNSAESREPVGGDRNAEPDPRPGHAPHHAKPPSKKHGAAEDDVTQRESLTEDVIRGTYECMVCCDRVRPNHEVWSCRNCYNIFHLRCIKKWALSPTASVDESGWRCPGCQNVTAKVPYQYRCFCAKMRNPEWNRYDTPHTCGEQCGRKRSQQNCVHPCNILCHPGPCPPCGIYIDGSCSCGSETTRVRCGQAKPFSCGRQCLRPLDCGKHACQSNCHSDLCDPCEAVLVRNCFCGKTAEEVPCASGAVAGTEYSCGDKCGKLLDCGNHQCDLTCHPGSCPPCRLAPSLLTHCPCGQTPLADLLANQPRRSCTDPVPICDKTCGNRLLCGPEDDPHRCGSRCHLDPCPPCPSTSFRRCRCGGSKREIACGELTPETVVLCEKRCNKKKNCGRHKCSQYCCVDATHRCTLVCGRRLRCGLHQCEETCHLGNCPLCWNTSFEELSCHCGAVVKYPPIPCNTKPPECSKPCSRRHGCDHAVTHSCHSEAQCPPCTHLTSKLCYGEHELRTCIPCFQTSVCCGMRCNKPLPCGQHRCLQICHEGPCASDTFKCMQPCPRVRPQCGHPCGMPCHDGDCPPHTCKATVAVTCHCSNRSGTMTCAENLLAFQRLMSSAMASKHHAVEQGQTVDISDIAKDGGLNKNCTLDCNDECTQIERNRRFALALQIQNPELTSKLKPPVYSDFLKEQTRQNGAFVASVFSKLTDLVQSAKQSKQRSRSHAFPTMKSDHRRAVHELAEFFGCETQSYDDEPKKNVVATAFKDKSWLPSTSIMTVVQKESGGTRQAGKAPPPIPHLTHRNSTLVPLSRPGSTGGVTNLASNNEGTPTKPEVSSLIDYFDYTE